MTNKTKKNKKNFSSFYPLFLAGLVFFILFFQGGAKVTKAEGEMPVGGWIWNENIGWISMSCVNQGTCGDTDYGVKIDASTKNFSGYAWSPNVGWISFQGTPPDETFSSNCLADCNGYLNCTACLDPDSGKVWGWAKILALGDDGWMKLRDDSDTWGVSIDFSSTASEGASFTGWAWNDGSAHGSGIGWTSFSCSNQVSCSSVPYYAYLSGSHIPQVATMSAPSRSYAGACVAGAKSATLSWTIKDDDPGSSQSAYRVIVSRTNNISDVVLDTSKQSGSAEQIAIPANGVLNYNTPYYWFVKVWDDFGLASDWKQFDTTASGTLTDNIDANNAISSNPNLTFTTYSHEFPVSNFSLSPTNPVVDEPVNYTANAGYYTDESPSASSTCDGTNCFYRWSGTGFKSGPANPTTATTSVIFNYSAGEGINTMKLNVTDLSGYSCTTSKPILTDVLPVWKEIKP